MKTSRLWPGALTVVGRHALGSVRSDAAHGHHRVTQDRINALNVERANTRIVEQRAKTAETEAKANDILAASVSDNPNVLVSECLDAARDASISPLGCWPNISAVPTVPVR